MTNIPFDDAPNPTLHQNRAARRGHDPLSEMLKQAVYKGRRMPSDHELRQQEQVNMERETTAPEATNPFLAALSGLEFEHQVPTDARLPQCPVCHAQAIAGYLHSNWHDLAHDCGCVLECEQAYLRGLRDIWASKMAYPTFMASLPERYREYTNLNSLSETRENIAPLRAARAGLKGNLYLHGPAGTGKSHLAVAAAAKLAQEGHTARFWGTAALFAALRDSVATGAPRPELLHWDVLVLDDIDKLKPTPYVYETFYTLAEERWARKKVTIFTAQLDADQAARVLTPEGNLLAADPLASRMGSGVVARIDGPDKRFRMDGGEG